MAETEVDSEISTDQEKNEHVHGLCEGGEQKDRKQPPPYAPATNHSGDQRSHFGHKRHMAEPPGQIHETKDREHAGDGDQRDSADYHRLPVIPGEQGTEARQSDQREQEKAEQAETPVDRDRLDCAAQRHVHLVQKPKPHGVAADEPERDLLEEKPAESDLNRLAHAPPLLQAVEDKLQPQSGDETGLAREHDE